MAERDKEKKRPGIVAHIFGFVGLILWSAIFITGIIYNIFSWLGIVIIVLFLAILVFGPIILHLTKRKQPLKAYNRITLGFWILLLGLLCIRFFWPDTETWRRYTFDDELAALEAERAIPDEENAATIYEPLLVRINPDVEKPDFFNENGCEFSASTRPWKGIEHPEFADWLDGYTDVLENLVLICQVEQCRFAIQADLFADSPERYAKLKFCARLLLSAANRDIGEGRIETGVKKYLCVIKITNHNYQQPKIMDFFVGSGIEGLALKPIYKFIVENNATDKILEPITETIDTKNNWSEDWPTILDVEKLEIKNICGRLYETNSKGNIRFTRHASTMFDKRPASTLETKSGDKLAATFMALFIPYSPEAVGKIVDDMYEKHYETAASDFDWDKLTEYDQYRLSQMQRLHGMRVLVRFGPLDASILPRIHNLYMRQVAVRRGCRLLIGLRHYKNKYEKWPQTLDEITDLAPSEAFIDPTNGGAFIYKLTEENFTIYSKGENNIDEDGKNRRYDRKTEADDVLIWPIRDSKDTKKLEV